MDLLDRAQEIEEQQRGDAIRAVTQHAPRGDWRRVSKKWCMAPLCGERIPDERRRASPGVLLCIECQTQKEKEPGRNR